MAPKSSKKPSSSLAHKSKPHSAALGVARSDGAGKKKKTGFAAKSQGKAKANTRAIRLSDIGLTADGLPSSHVAPYGLGTTAMDRLGRYAGVPSINTLGKKMLLKIVSPWMDNVVFQTVITARGDQLQTVKSEHVGIVADAHGISLQC